MYGLRATTFPVDFVWFLIVLMGWDCISFWWFCGCFVLRVGGWWFGFIGLVGYWSFISYCCRLLGCMVRLVYSFGNVG